MTENGRQHLIEAGVAVGLLLGLFWLLLHYLPQGQSAPLSTDDPTGQSAQPNFFPVAVETPVGVPIDAVPAQPIGLVLLTPGQTPNGGLDECSCGTGTNCPVSPYTIASVNKMQMLGTEYANAIIAAGNNTAAAIAQLADVQYTFPVLQLNQLEAA